MNEEIDFEYIVTIINVDLEVNKYSFNNLVDLDAFVIEINKENYWQIQKIEKIRRYKFEYDKEIIHKPLFACFDNVTEMDLDHSFLIKDESLTNIKRVL